MTRTSRASTSLSTAPSSSPSPLLVADDERRAYDGTFFAAIAYPHSSDPNYVLFFQRANGDLMKVVYNGTGWHKPTFVADDARTGTGLSVARMGGALEDNIWLYYIDKANTLQELRGTHASDARARGGS